VGVLGASSSEVAQVFRGARGDGPGLSLLARRSDRLGISTVPAHLLVGLGFGRGGVTGPELSAEFLDLTAEIGVLLLLLTLGLEYTGDEWRHELKRGRVAGVVDLVANFTPGAPAARALGWGDRGDAARRHHRRLLLGRDRQGARRPQPLGQQGDAHHPVRPTRHWWV
jgi:CPA2 family monovalent cation:H+ antiporter-2